VHTLFNVMGVVIWIGFIPQLAELTRMFSPSHFELSGMARAAAEVPRQLANIHTFFNVVNALLFVGFTIQIQRLVEWLVPDRPIPEEERIAARYLNEEFLGTPAIALDATRREIGRLGNLVRKMLHTSLECASSATQLQLEELEILDRPVDALHREIISYLRELSIRNLSPENSDTMMALIKVANDLEHIGDQLATTLVTSGRKRIKDGVIVSKQTANVIREFHMKVLDSLDGTLASLDRQDADLAAEVRAMKQDVALMTDKLARHGISRLKADEPKRLMTYAREIEIVEILNDIFKTTRRIARTEIDLFDAHGRDGVAQSGK
jgi:phosphate:Na+ symporter